MWHVDQQLLNKCFVVELLGIFPHICINRFRICSFISVGLHRFASSDICTFSHALRYVHDSCLIIRHHLPSFIHWIQGVLHCRSLEVCFLVVDGKFHQAYYLPVKLSYIDANCTSQKSKLARRIQWMKAIWEGAKKFLELRFTKS